MACHPLRTEHEDADEDEGPSQRSECFPFLAGPLNEPNGSLNARLPSEWIGAMRTRRRLVGYGVPTLGACNQARPSLRCVGAGYSSPSSRPSRISFTASR